MKQTLLIIQFCSSLLFGFTLSDTAQEIDTIAVLMERVSQLEVELDEVKRESTQNPISSGTYKKWGKGLTIAVEYPYLSAELGYTFKVAKEQVRLGLSGGYALRPNSISEWPDSLSNESRHNIFWKVMVGTPVFFNLMSFSGSIGQLYVPGSSASSFAAIGDSTNGDISVYETNDLLYATQLGANAECWISPKMNIYVGINVHFNQYKKSVIYKAEHGPEDWERLGEYGGSETWITNNFKVGARYYFGTFRSMNENRKRRAKNREK